MLLDAYLHDRHVPRALTVPCERHDAAAGVLCFHTARGVCGDRLDAVGANRPAPEGLERVAADGTSTIDTNRIRTRTRHPNR